MYCLPFKAMYVVDVGVGVFYALSCACLLRSDNSLLWIPLG